MDEYEYAMQTNDDMSQRSHGRAEDVQEGKNTKHTSRQFKDILLYDTVAMVMIDTDGGSLARMVNDTDGDN